MREAEEQRLVEQFGARLLAGKGIGMAAWQSLSARDQALFQDTVGPGWAPFRIVRVGSRSQDACLYQHDLGLAAGRTDAISGAGRRQVRSPAAHEAGKAFFRVKTKPVVSATRTSSSLLVVDWWGPAHCASLSRSSNP